MTGGPKYYIQSAHDPNDWDWGEVPSADLANIIVPAGYSVDLYAMVPIGDGNAGQDCGNVGNIAGTVCDHAMGLDESPNYATGDTDWVDTGFRFVEDDQTMHDGSLGIQREIWVKRGVSGTYTVRHPVTHGWGYMYFVSDTYFGTGRRWWRWRRWRLRQERVAGTCGPVETVGTGAKGTTYQLSIEPAAGATNIYTIFGDADDDMVIPRATKRPLPSAPTPAACPRPLCPSSPPRRSIRG